MENDVVIKFDDLQKSQKLTSVAQMFMHTTFGGIYAKHVVDCIKYLDELAVEAKIEENRIAAVERCVNDNIFDDYKDAIERERFKIAEELGCPAIMDDAEFADADYATQEKYKDLSHLVLKNLGRWEEYLDKYKNDYQIRLYTLRYKLISLAEDFSNLDLGEFVANLKAAFSVSETKLEVVK